MTDTQANELSLALSMVSVRPIQTLVRLRATRGGTERALEALATGPEAKLLLPGQRARVYTLHSRSSMVQARLQQVAQRGEGAHLKIALAGPLTAPEASDLLVEIVVERGTFLSVPNEALIEEGTHRNVYVRTPAGDYEARRIEVGVQGEIYSAVIAGLEDGEQVVTTGSFFIDADYKMKGGG